MSRPKYAEPKQEEREAQTMRRLVDAAEAEAAERESQAPLRRSALLVGAANDPAEAAADAVADRVVSRLATLPAPSEAPAGQVRRSADPGGGGVIGASGGELDATAAGEIAGARGGGSPLPEGVRRRMEAGFGGSLGGDRVHTDARAGRLSRAMSARAFTAGRDIFFGRGEFAPGTPDGERVLAHELAHTRQDGALAHRAMAAPVRRKLAGVSTALESQGGGETSGGFRKFFGRKTNWDKIVSEVRKYEAEEAGVTTTALFGRARTRLLSIVGNIRKHVADWNEANPDRPEKRRTRGTQEDLEEFHSTGGAPNTTDPNQLQPGRDFDPRTKSGRRQAVYQLNLLAGDEARMLNQPDGNEWLGKPALTSLNAHETGVTMGGQVNQLHQADYTLPGGQQMRGLFKRDLGQAPNQTPGEQEVGIPNLDPGYAARAKALRKLDELFNAGVTARVFSAVRTDPTTGKTRLGTVIEQVQGVQGGSVNWARDQQHGEQLGQEGKQHVISLDDPVLQRGLNKLQLLDAICGQLDRHQNNFMVQQDEHGTVTGVTGIDLDMAFGRQMRSPHKQNTPGVAPGQGGPHSAFNYRGLPPEIDAVMGERILQVTPDDVRAALTGLLPDAEVEATVARFAEVRRVVQEVKDTTGLRSQWGQQSNRPHSSWETTKARNASSYHGDTREDARVDLESKLTTRIKNDVTARLAALPADSDWKKLPEKISAELLSSMIYLNERFGTMESDGGHPEPQGGKWTENLRTTMFEQNFSSTRIGACGPRAVDALVEFMQVFLYSFEARVDELKEKGGNETAMERRRLLDAIHSAIQIHMNMKLDEIMRE
ncbi:MAG: DUF4157 domain-containing protein [Actinomycetia bacterium]|nr:DUF4157 domain-containing protein [Actinomycetes bacterium]